MQRVTIFILLVVLSLNWACNTQKPALSTPEGISHPDSLFSYQGDTSDINVLETSEKIIPAFVMASLKRTGCYGKCPVYEAQILSNGLVLYHGYQFTERQGAHQAYLTQVQMDSLMAQVEAAHFFDLQPLYPDEGIKLMDLPNTFTYFKRDTLEKEIINNHNAPKSLKQLEAYFDALLNQLEWEPHQ